MLKVNLKNGSTLTRDLFDETDQERWRELANGNGGASIRALGIHDQGVMYALPFPVRFRRIQFDAEGIRQNERPVAEKVLCYADDIRITMTVYKKTRMSRIDVDKVGRLAYRAKTRR